MHVSSSVAVSLLVVLAAGSARAIEDSECLACHGDANFGVAGPDGTIRHLYVDKEMFDASVHGGGGCTACHEDATEAKHKPGLAKVKCGTCHEEYEGYERSLPERMMLHDFKIVADNAGSPVGYEQEDKLIRMMHEERAAVPELSELYDNEGEAVAVTKDRGLEIIRAVNVWHDRVLMRAREMLDERQMYFFEGQVQQIRDVIEVGISMAPLVMEGQ